MREVNQKQLVCKVTKRSEGRERIGQKVCFELERLGVSAEILESLWKAQENRPKLQKNQ